MQGSLKWTRTLPAIVAAGVLGAQSAFGAVAYNDFGGTASSVGGKTVNNIGGNTSADLLDYDSGTKLALLTVGTTFGPVASGGVTAPAATPFDDVFGGIVNPQGPIYNASFTVTIGDLDPSKQYEIVIGSDRANSSNVWHTEFAISGADAWTNTSSLGVYVIGGNNVNTFDGPTDPSTIIAINNNSNAGVTARNNGNFGMVAAFSGIRPGVDGAFTITVLAGPNDTNSPSNGYINALRLTESDVPEPASLVLAGLGGLVLLRRRH